MAKTASSRQALPLQYRIWPSPRTYLIAAVALFAVLLAPFLNTIFLAAIFAFFFYPYLVALKRRTKISKSRFLTVTFSLILVAALALSFFGVSSLFDVTKANRDLLMRISRVEFALPQKLSQQIVKRFPEQADQVATLAQDTLNSIKTFLIRATSDFFQSVPFFMMNVLSFFVALHFFLAKSAAIRRHVLRMRLMPADQLRFLTRSAREAARETFISVLLIGLIQTVIVTLGALAIGFEHVVLVFFVTFLLSLIPVIGAAPGAFLIGLYMFFRGEIGYGTTMVIVSIITGTVDNVLRSWLMSKSNKLPAGISFVCLIGSIIVFGFYGIFFGPFLGFLASKFLTRRINGTALA